VTRQAILVVFLGIAVLASPAYCQQMTVTIDKPFVSRSLSGIVSDASGKPIPGALVELKTHGWKQYVKGTKTNANGWFGFRTNREATYYLSIPAYSAFQEHYIKIRVRRTARRTPQIRLEVAT
jgi:hypothetical protein